MVMQNYYDFQKKKQWRPERKRSKLSGVHGTHNATSAMTTAYMNGQVIDGRGKAYKGYVIVDGEKIAEAREGTPAALAESTLKIDLAGKTILPGLIDCHVHLRSD